MSDVFKGIAGWERHGNEMMLRMKLSKPSLRRVWPGAPSLTPPEGELRLLTEVVLPRYEVRKAVTDMKYAAACGYSADDLTLLRRALNDPPHVRKQRHVPDWQPWAGR